MAFLPAGVTLTRFSASETTAIHLVVLGLFVLFLVEAEVLRAARGTDATLSLRVLAVAVPALAIASAVILFGRIGGAG